MAKQNSFDIVSQVDMAEVKNAVNQATKELVQRFDLKGSNSSIELNDKDGKLVLASADEFRLNAVNSILQQKLVRRGVSLKALTYGTVDPAAHGTVRQTVTLQQGIPIEQAREIVKIIKKVQAQGSGFHQRRHGARLGQGPRHPAGGHGPRQGARVADRHAVHQLPVVAGGPTATRKGTP